MIDKGIKYEDQRLTKKQKKKIKPANQGGGPNYLGKQKTVTVPKKWLSDPNHVVAELAYITPREKKILIDLDLYGSLNGKPNRGPAGIQSLQGDMGGFGGTGGPSGGNNNGGNNNGGGGGRQDTESQYGGDYSYDSSQNVSDREQQYGGGRDPSKQYEIPTDLTISQKETLEKQRKQAQYAISPSTDPKNKVIGGLLSTVLFPGAGTLYGMYKDATALGYPISNPFSGIFGTDNITENTIQDFKDRGGGDGNEGMQLIQNVLKIVNPDMPESVAQKYYDAIPQTEKTELSFKARYNNMKNNVNGILNSPSPVGLLAVNESPFYDFLKTRGLDRRIL